MKRLLCVSALILMICPYASGSNECKIIKDNAVGVLSLFDIDAVSTYYRTGDHTILKQLALEGKIQLLRKGVRVVDVGYACKRGHWKVKLVGTTTEVWMHHSHYKCK